MKMLTILLVSVLLCLCCDGEGFEVDAGPGADTGSQTWSCVDGEMKCGGAPDDAEYQPYVLICDDNSWVIVDNCCDNYTEGYQCVDPPNADPFCEII